MCVSSLACGNPSLAPGFGKFGEGIMEFGDGSGRCAQLKSGEGGRMGIADCFEGIEVEEEVFRVEENSWER